MSAHTIYVCTIKNLDLTNYIVLCYKYLIFFIKYYFKKITYYNFIYNHL